jgi:hypothetical protein
MPRPLYPRGKSPLYPLDSRLGGPQYRPGLHREEKNLKLHHENKKSSQKRKVSAHVKNNILIKLTQIAINKSLSYCMNTTIGSSTVSHPI